MEKTVIKFKKRHDKWMKGEIACFSNEEAERIIKTGDAEFCSKVTLENGDNKIINGGSSWKKRVAGVEEAPRFICPICGMEFSNQAEKDAHKWEVHGIE
jgi:hypothetical protein